ncbi:MAG: hypothetical protein ABR583_04310 [Gaiellaceae bacterium]
MGGLRLLQPASTVRVHGARRRVRTMAETLRPLRIRLADPASVGALLDFLRRRACVAEQVSATTLEVWPPPLLHEPDGGPRAADPSSLGLGVEEVACSGCGSAVEEALSRLGSPRCHDCRDEPPTTASVAPLQQERARVELQAYLRAWRLANGDAAAVIE